MDILRFTAQSIGFLLFLTALFMLVTHTSPDLDFLHPGRGYQEAIASAGFLEHVVAAIMLGGVGYLFLSWGKGS